MSNPEVPDGISFLIATTKEKFLPRMLAIEKGTSSTYQTFKITEHPLGFEFDGVKDDRGVFSTHNFVVCGSRSCSFFKDDVLLHVCKVDPAVKGLGAFCVTPKEAPQ